MSEENKNEIKQKYLEIDPENLLLNDQLLRLEEHKKSGKISEEVYNLRKQDLEKRREREQRLLADAFETCMSSFGKN